MPHVASQIILLPDLRSAFLILMNLLSWLIILTNRIYPVFVFPGYISQNSVAENRNILTVLSKKRFSNGNSRHINIVKIL